MRFRRYPSVLSDCLDELRAGATVEQCLKRYPKHADRLAPALTLADRIMRAPTAQPRPDAKERGWNLLRARAAQLRAGKQPVLRVPAIGPSFRVWLKAGAVAVAVVGLFAAGSGGLAYASQDALPDSPLYRVKLLTEEVHLLLIFDDTSEAGVLLDQSDERMDEIIAVVGKGKPVPENALAALQDRNERAAEIISRNTGNTALRARLTALAQEQEELLVSLWPEVPEDARGRYASAVADLHNTRLAFGAPGSEFASVLPEELSGGILSIAGQAEEIGEGLWRVGGVEVRIDERTIGRTEIQPGTSARFVVARSSNGRLHALSLTNIGAGTAPAAAVVSGEVEEITEDGVRIAGNFIPFDETTVQTLPLQVGQRVQITLGTGPDGVVADTVKAASAPDAIRTLTFEGTVSGDVSRSTSRWTVGGLEFAITPTTTFDARGGAAADGARVQVEAMNRSGQMEALRVTVLSSADPPDAITIIGTFDGFNASEGVWLVSGVEIVPPETGDDPPEGALVIVDARREGPDLFTTMYDTIESPEDPALVRFQGTISAIDGSRWTMEFGQVRVQSTAHVIGRPAVGVRAIVWGERGVDGSLQARYAKILDDAPVLTPTPVAPTPASP